MFEPFYPLVNSNGYVEKVPEFINKRKTSDSSFLIIKKLTLHTRLPHFFKWHGSFADKCSVPPSLKSKASHEPWLHNCSPRLKLNQNIRHL